MVSPHDPVEARLNEVVALLNVVLEKEMENMALGQDILAAIEAENTVIDSFIALVNGLVQNNTIDPATAAAILQAIADQKAEVEAAIVANTPVTP